MLRNRTETRFERHVRQARRLGVNPGASLGAQPGLLFDLALDGFGRFKLQT